MRPGFTAEQLLLNDIFLEYMFDRNPETAARWNEFARDNAIDDTTIAKATEMLGMLSPGVEEREVEEEIKKLRQTISDNETAQAASRRKRLLRLLGVTAVLAVIIFGAVFYSSTSQPGEKVVASFSTADGEHKQVSLPDGSMVILNSRTTISYGDRYNQRNRQVMLNGEAFFRVVKDPARPFTVIHENFVTTAIGTAFYVYADSSRSYKVELLEGKVKVASSVSGPPKYLDAGEQLFWQNDSKRFVTRPYDTSYLNNWSQGKIVFERMPSEQAFKILERWYRVNIIDRRAAPSGALITGSYENVGLADVLKVVCFSLHCRFRTNGQSVIIE